MPTAQIGGNVAGRTLNTIIDRMNKIGTNSYGCRPIKFELSSDNLYVNIDALHSTLRACEYSLGEESVTEIQDNEICNLLKE